MTFSIIEVTDKKVVILARLESGPVIGDSMFEIHPGEEIFGINFDDLVKMGVGPHKMPTS